MRKATTCTTWICKQFRNFWVFPIFHEVGVENEVFLYILSYYHSGLSILTKYTFSLEIVPHVNPTLVETLSNPAWTLYSGTSQDETETPSSDIYNTWIKYYLLR